MRWLHSDRCRNRTNACTLKGTALASYIGVPQGIFVDTSGNVFFGSYNCHQIYKISTSGVMTVFAGNGTLGYSGDDGLATSAALNHPYDIFVNAAGDGYIADASNNLIRYVDHATGNISTLAGNFANYGTTGGFGGDGGPATSAGMHMPIGITADSNGSYYIADLQDNRIRKVTLPGAGLTLTITLGGTGSGVVTSNNGSIGCPGSCTTTLAQGGQLLLIETPNSGSVASGFSGGGCSTNPCTFTMGSGNSGVTANFRPVGPNVSKSGAQTETRH